MPGLSVAALIPSRISLRVLPAERSRVKESPPAAMTSWSPADPPKVWVLAKLSEPSLWRSARRRTSTWYWPADALSLALTVNRASWLDEALVA